MSDPATVLVIDDEPHIRRLLRATLERAPYQVVEAATATDGLSALAEHAPDLVLLDLGLPDRDGLELVSLVKRRSAATLIIVSAREATEEKVAALDLGADDYVTKPFDTDELLARLRAALRHRATARDAPARVIVGDIEIDLADRRVLRRGEDIHLTQKEYGVVAELARHPGRVVTHDQLLRSVWAGEHERHVEYLRVVVRNVRQKIEPDPGRPAIVVNELGIGYRLLGADS